MLDRVIEVGRGDLGLVVITRGVVGAGDVADGVLGVEESRGDRVLVMTSGHFLTAAFLAADSLLALPAGDTRFNLSPCGEFC